MEIDFSDLDASSKPSAMKPGKFAPKNSKFRPKRQPQPPIPSSHFNSNPAPVPVPPVKLEDSKPTPPMPAAVNSRTNIEQPSHNVTDPAAPDVNFSVKMDMGATEMEVDNDDLQQGEEDQVVREIYVFLTSSPDANSKLYVLQYPLRQRWRPYELEERCEEVRLKPKTAEVEVQMSAQFDSHNFDPDVSDDKAMPKQVLSTSWKKPPITSYAVGILMGNELHLNLVDAVVQLRPSMQHLKLPNKQDTKTPGAVNEQNKYTKEEEWIPLKYEASQMSHRRMQNMVAAQEASQIQFSMTRSDYLYSLCPTCVIPDDPSISALLKLPLEDRFKSKLRKGYPLRFSVFKHLAPDSSIEDILKILKSLAHLVQGLWFAKTKLLKYDEKYEEEKAAERALFRDFLMLQFSKNPVVHDSQLLKTKTITHTETKTGTKTKPMMKLLGELSRRRDCFQDWKLKEPTDDLFIKEYPSIVEEQKKIWDRVEPQIIEYMFRKASKRSIGNSV